MPSHSENVGDAERVGVGRAAAICGFTPKTMRKLAKDGKIPGAAFLGNNWRFDERRLRDWIRRQEGACLTVEETTSFKRGGVWYARILIRGRDVRRSLRTSSRAEAKKRLPAILAQAEHFRFYGEHRHTWKQAVVEWAASGTALSPSTLKRYLVSFGQLRGILDELFVDEITPRTIAQIGRRPGVSNATKRRDITAVSVVLRWCVSQNWREDNPAASWDRSIIRERRDPIVLPESYAIDCVIAAAPGNFSQLIRFAQYTGMREE